MKLRLNVTLAGKSPFAFEHAGPTCNMGRDASCELSFQGDSASSVSWRHARIDLEPDGAWVSDLQSSNGTYIEDRRVQERSALQVGDQVRLGLTGPSLRVMAIDLPTPVSATLMEPIAALSARAPAPSPLPPLPAAEKVTRFATAVAAVAPRVEPAGVAPVRPRPQPSGATESTAGVSRPPLLPVYLVGAGLACLVLVLLWQVLRQAGQIRTLGDSAAGLVDDNQALRAEVTSLAEKVTRLANERPADASRETKELSRNINQLLEKLSPPSEKPDKGSTPGPAVTPVPPLPSPPAAPSSNRVEVGRVGPVPRGMVDLLLRKQRGADAWQRVRLDEAVQGTDTLTCLPGYRGEVRLKSGVRLLLWGDLDLREPVLPVLESRVVLHEPGRGVDLDLTVERGRLVLANHKEKGEAVVRLRFRENSWDLHLPGKDAQMAVELRGGYLLGAPLRVDGSGPLPLTILNFTARGGAEVKVLKAPPPGPNPDMLTFRLLDPEPAESLWPQLTEWWAGTLKEPEAEAVAILKQLGDYLDRGSASVADQLVLARQANSLTPLAQALGTFGLGAVDNLSAQVEALEDSRHAVREAALVTLRQWLGRGGDQDRKVYDYVKAQRSFADARAQKFVQWLHGFTEQERRPGAVAVLLEGLADPNLAMRHLAAVRLGEWFPPPEGKSSYDPAADLALRNRAIQEWKTSLPAEFK